MNQSDEKPYRFRVRQESKILLVLIGMIIFMTILNPNFLTFDNIMNLLAQTSIYGILTIGAFMVIVSGGIDLSLGSVLAFAGIIAGVFSQTSDAVNKIFPELGTVPFVITILIALVAGAILGGTNGLLISKFNLPPFIATLGMQITARGAALFISGGRPVSNVNPMVNFFGEELWGWLPVPFLVFMLVVIVVTIIMRYTSFGKSIYAMGDNMEAAKVSGIKVSRNQTLVYAIAGMLAGLAALVYLGRTGGSIQPAAATGYELTAIAAATIGGTSQTGGIGTVPGAVIGALILGTLINGFTLLGIDAYVQQIILGIIIVGSVLIDMRKKKKDRN